ncbi:MAG: 16S rRNA (guanine(527)-N(7))-methyltransferase RsmG [Actinomycetota bacterium]|nr:16S rRNA (guanine(527)-N(7))-methyltransferase RsmG [Actinomycetota bacterium]
MTDPRLERWLEALVATPGLTSVHDPGKARRVHLDDSLAALEVVRRFEGSIVDVGSGGGAPGIPLAAALPDREVTLLESNRRKCVFLERWATEFPNLRVVCGRAEEQPVDGFGVAVAKALAPPSVAAEWCLPLVAPGGAAVLFVGPSAEAERVAAVAEQLAAGLVESPPGLLVLRKHGPTPPGFPRRPGIARKRPLA